MDISRFVGAAIGLMLLLPIAYLIGKWIDEWEEEEARLRRRMQRYYGRRVRD